LDTLLVDLKNSKVGCWWGEEYAGALAFADDVMLLAVAPSVSAM
jgi:hypothetical protein